MTHPTLRQFLADRCGEDWCSHQAQNVAQHCRYRVDLSGGSADPGYYWSWRLYLRGRSDARLFIHDSATDLVPAERRFCVWVMVDGRGRWTARS
jgi:hypothetical protein